MNSQRDVGKILQDISMLYELSLCLGQSIDLHENCDGFLRVLLARKSLNFCSVWIRDEAISGEVSKGTLVRVYANPRQTTEPQHIASDHPLALRILHDDTLSLQDTDPSFGPLLAGVSTIAGSFAAFRLGDLGFLAIGAAARPEAFGPLELKKLRGVIAKFTFSIQGCLDHDRVRTADARRRELELQVARTQKLKSLGLMAGGVAHDFNNLLSAIQGNAELLRESIQDDDQRQLIDRVIGASSHAASLAEQLLACSGGTPMRPTPHDLNSIVRDILTVTSVTVSKRAHLIETLADGLPWVDGDASQIRQIVTNLVTNASEALGDNEGDIDVRTGLVDVSFDELSEYHLGAQREPGRYIFLEVQDTGCGMDAATQENLFDPFFTTKATGRGLGLAALLGIVRAHGGAIRVRSLHGVGTGVRVLLPISTRQVPIPKTTVYAPGPVKMRGTALVVDDDRAVRSILGRLLQRIGFHVLFAEDGRLALEVFAERRRDIDLVFLDLTMPNMGGAEVFERMQALDPNVSIVICSGYTEARLDSLFENQAPASFLKKPFGKEAVLAATQLATLHRQATPAPDGSDS